jgi:hypothetical protein
MFLSRWVFRNCSTEGDLFQDLLVLVASMEPQNWTEITAVALATFAIPFGIGSTAWKGYTQGKCFLPARFVWMVNTPLGIAMALRIATFILDQKYYYFFITLKSIGFVLAVIIQGQLYGLFLRKVQPDSGVVQ